MSLLSGQGVNTEWVIILLIQFWNWMGILELIFWFYFSNCITDLATLFPFSPSSQFVHRLARMKSGELWSPSHRRKCLKLQGNDMILPLYLFWHHIYVIYLCHFSATLLYEKRKSITKLNRWMFPSRFILLTQILWFCKMFYYYSCETMRLTLESLFFRNNIFNT